MGAIRGILLVVICILTFLLILIGGVLWTMSSSLQYENVQPGLSSFVTSFVNEQVNSIGGQLNLEDEIDTLMPTIEAYCQTSQEYVFQYEGQTITIPCDALVQGPEAVISEGVGSLIDQYYYQEYNCNFWDCFSENDIPLFLISQKAQNYWQGKFRLALLGFLIVMGLIFLLVEKKTNFFILTGGLTILASLPLLKVGAVTNRLTNSIGDLGEYASELVLIFFNQSQNVFVRIVLFGAVLLVVGIVMKVFKIGFSIANFIGRFKGKGSKPKVVEKKVEKRKIVPSKAGKDKKEFVEKKGKK